MCHHFTPKVRNLVVYLSVHFTSSFQVFGALLVVVVLATKDEAASKKSDGANNPETIIGFEYETAADELDHEVFRRSAEPQYGRGGYGGGRGGYGGGRRGGYGGGRGFRGGYGGGRGGYGGGRGGYGGGRGFRG